MPVDNTVSAIEMTTTRIELGKDAERAFNARVKELRLASGLTQEALATWMTAAGYPMHQTTVAKLELGGRPTPVCEVAALAALFDVPIGSFFDTTNEVDAVRLRLARADFLLATQAKELAELDERIARLRAEHAAAQTELDWNVQCTPTSARPSGVIPFADQF